MFLSIIITFVLLSFTFVTSVEASSVVWCQTYGGADDDWGACVIETSDGGYAVAGTTRALEINQKFLLIKVDCYGNMEWNKTYEETEGFLAYSLVETSDGGYILGGGTRSLAGGGILIKTNSLGDVEWYETYEPTFNSVVETSDGGYMLAGSTSPIDDSYDDEPKDFCLAKTDSTGTIQWNRTYGSPEDDTAYELIKTADGYVLAGYTSVNDTEEIWLVKTDASGNMIWNKTYENFNKMFFTISPSSFFIPPFALVATSDGGYAIAVHTGDGFKIDFSLVKTDRYGNIEWNATIGGPDIDWPTSMLVASDGGYVLAGNTESSGAGGVDFWLIKTDEFGNLEWKQTYGGTGNDFVYSIVATSDDEYLLAGRTNSFGGGVKENDFWVVKTPGCGKRHNLQTYEFDFSYGYGEYVVVVSTNSTVGGFDFGINQNQINFTVTGPTGTTGVCKIIIPEDLVGTNFPIYLGQELLTEGEDYTKTYNGTHTIIDMTYNHSTHTVVIVGTNVIPEFQPWMILPLVAIATFVPVIYKKRLLKNSKNHH